MTAKHRWIGIGIAVAVGLGSAGVASAQWKWRDAAGRTQYSDLPPPQGTPEKDILQRPAVATRPATAPVASSSSPAVASAPPLSAARASDPELEARRRRAEQELAEKKRAEDAKLATARAENCARARESKRTVDSGVRITRTNERGEREYLDDAARAAEGRKAQQVIDADCR